MSANHNNPNLGKYVPCVLSTCNFRTATLTMLVLFFGATLFAQRIVFPGQDLLAPHLNDPSYLGLENRMNVTGVLQVTDYARRQHSQYIYAQIPFSSKLSFGADYFKDALDFYSYSTAMASAAVKFDFGGENSYLRLGVSGGIDSRRQTGFPADEITNMESFVPKLNEGDTSFTYRLGIHYAYNALSIGGTYNKLPIQNTLVRANQEDLIGYWIKDGFTAHVRYSLYLSENLRLTPLFRYLSYANDPIYEGALLVDVGNQFSASLSYKNDYSINPAVRYEFLDTYQVGYSYEKSIGDVTFDAVHSLSITYKFKGDGAEGSDWQETAKANNRKIAAIKRKKPEKEKTDEPETEVEKDVTPEVNEQKDAAEKEAAQREAAQKEAAQKEAAQKEAAQQEVSQKEAAQKEAAEREAAQKEAAEREATERGAAQKAAAEREAAQKEAAQKEAAEREAAQKEAADREAAQKVATEREAAQEEAAEREVARKEAAQKEAAEREAAQKEATQQEEAQKEAAQKEAEREAAQKVATEREAAQKAAAEREVARKEAAQKEAAEREAAQKEAAEREAAQKVASEREAAQEEAAEREEARKEAAQKEAAQEEAAEREAAQKEAAEREAAQKVASEREAAQEEAAEREVARKEAAEREAEQKVEQKEVEPVKENPIEEIEPVELDPSQPRFAKDGSVMKTGYYVIVGTYDSMAQAEAEKARLALLEYYTAIGLKKGDATFYLYVDYDDLNEDAKKRLRAHNLDPNFRKAYLLEVD